MSYVWNRGGQPLVGNGGGGPTLPPSWAGDDTPQPGWVYAATYNNGDTAQIDPGAALNGPTSFSYQVVRSDGSNATGTGNSGSHVAASAMLYTFNSVDSKLQLSALVTAENSLGNDMTTIASITVE